MVELLPPFLLTNGEFRDSEKQDGGMKVTKVFRIRKKRNYHGFEKYKSTRKNFQTIFKRLAKYVYCVETNLKTSF
jgi:hypothetical protein